jgi:hypothetical protein
MIYRILFVLIIIVLALVLFYLLTRDTKSQIDNTTITQPNTTVKEGFNDNEPLLTEDELESSVKVVINETTTADDIRTLIADVGEGVDVYEYDDDLYILATARFETEPDTTDVGTEGEEVADTGEGVGTEGEEVADTGEGVGTEGEGVGTEGEGIADTGVGEGTEGEGVGTEGEEVADTGEGVGTEGEGVGTDGEGVADTGVGEGTEGVGEGTEGEGVGTEGEGDDFFRNVDGQRQLIFEPELPQESIDALITLIENEGDNIIITNSATTTTQEPATTTNPLNAYNQVINKLDALITDDRRAEIPNELKIDILELPQTQRESLCEDYCQIYEGGCTPLCNFLGCENCTQSSQNQQPAYRQPDEANQAQVPRTQGNTHIPDSPPNPMNISQSGNGESNIFAPYVVVHKKKPGERYNAYVMTNPHDPNYYNYINNLS